MTMTERRTPSTAPVWHARLAGILLLAALSAVIAASNKYLPLLIGLMR